ncbi:hypothetical protein [Brevundimonas sp. DC300-4]|uniref:hypothetical protein n=1 Tax=Brevundimonas sp. DC300-4 TaxID=2804594 RepID=UPI003CE78856
MSPPSQEDTVDRGSTTTTRVLVTDLARNIIVHGPQLGNQVTFAATTRLYSHTHQCVAEALTEALEGSFATSGLRFGVAMLIGIDPTAPPDDVEHLIDVWLETCAVFNTVAMSEIGDGGEGLLTGMLSAWVTDYGPVQARGRA